MADQEKEIQALKEELSKANEEIEKLSRIKSGFISVVSHELRTPLTAIKESVSLMLDGVAGPISEEQKKILTISKNNIERLAKLIIDILDLSKLEAGRILIRKRKLSVNDVIKDVYASTKILAEQKNIEFTISLGESVEPTWFDPDRIGQVFKNLISNAIKFNRENGKIRISSSKETIKNRDFIKVTIEDNGIGISTEDKENLFRYFTPLDTSMTRKHSGIGIGLAISKGMIELHGGDIWVVSEPDVGSKLIVTIPLYKKHEEFDFLIEEAMEKAKHNDARISLIVFDIKDAKDRTEDVINGIEGIIKKTVKGPEDKVVRCKKGECIVIIACADRPGAMAIIKRLKGNIKAPLIFGISVYPDEAMDKEELLKKAEEDLKSGKNLMASKRVLLIIDDEEALTSMLSFRLQNSGFDTIIANDGDMGVGLAKENKPDLILLDLMMPKVDGFEVSKRLKSDSVTKHIPIVIFSALGNKNTKESIKKLGATGFIEKPFEPNILIDKINKILEGKNG
ncbi:MAG: response regulator [Candidatus Omnitrophica bacterium]|nr:response regulator [Candidatus Omnitrophota bacterium]